MLAIPLQTGPQQFQLAVILEQENIDRVMEYDPAEIDIAKLALPWRLWHCHRVVLFFATAEEVVEIRNNPGSVLKLLQRLGRGFKYQPRAGDHDHAYPPAGNS